MENNNLIDLENKIKAFFATTLEDMNVKLSADMEMIDQIKQDLRDFIYLFKEFHNEVLASLPKPAEKNRSRTPNKITATAKKPGMAKTTRENTSRSKTPVGKITSNTLNKTSVNIQSKPGVKNTPLKKTNKLDTQAKNLKRDLTPTPGSRKNNPLDVSQDNTKKKKNSVLVGSKPNLNGKEKEKSNISSSRLPTQTNEDKISSPEKPFTNIENTPQKEEQEKKEILNKEELTNDSKVNSEVKICFSNKASSNDLPNPTETPKVEEEVQAKPVELSKDAAINERFDSRIKNGKLFSTKSLNCLYLVANSEICPDVLRTTLILSHKEICEENTLKKFLHDRINRLTNEITNKEQLVKQYDPADKFLKPFAPTKTAQNGLNFVTKEEEGNLCKKEQPEIINVFKLIYILLNESYEELEPQKIIENLIQNLFVKYNVENIKSLFVNHIAKSMAFTEEQYSKMSTLVTDNPKILSSADLLKMSRSVSYMTFILKEIYDYTTYKLGDGSSAFEIRKTFNDLSNLKRKQDYLKSFL